MGMLGAGRTGAKLSKKVEGINAGVVSIRKTDGKGILPDKMPRGRSDLAGDLCHFNGPLTGPFVDAGGTGARKPEEYVVIMRFVTIPPYDMDGMGVRSVNLLRSDRGHCPILSWRRDLWAKGRQIKEDYESSSSDRSGRFMSSAKVSFRSAFS